MASQIIYQGVTEVEGYGPPLVNLNPLGTFFLEIDLIEPSMTFPRYYGDFIQVLPNFPYDDVYSEVYHQQIWLDRVELNIRRDFGNTFITQAAFRWLVNGASWRLWQY